jgi:hypothetical protein
MPLRNSHCVCEDPGTLNCGIPEILAGVPGKRGLRYIERCDACLRFDSDADACMEYIRLKGGWCTLDRETRNIWFPR